MILIFIIDIIININIVIIIIITVTKLLAAIAVFLLEGFIPVDFNVLCVFYL